MFVLIQFPLVDLRPIVPGEMGRLTVPDWSAADPGISFIRGFGKMAARNSRGFGLAGERAFADFNNAVRFRDTLYYNQQGWSQKIRAELEFRRLYFDGKLAGRFEYGFLMNPAQESEVLRDHEEFAYDVGSLVAQILALPLVVRTPDGRESEATIGTCGNALGLAYALATTKLNAVSRFPPAETYGSFVAVGHPFVYVRVSGGVAVKTSRDRRELDGRSGKLYIMSANQSQIRNNVIVQMSEMGAVNESAEERATRVLFSHMNALLFAEIHFLSINEKLQLRRSALRDAVQDMLQRLEQLGANGADDEKDFSAAIRLFTQVYEGRTDELVDKLEELAKQTIAPSAVKAAGAAVGNYVQGIIELIIKTTVETVVKAKTG